MLIESYGSVFFLSLKRWCCVQLPKAVEMSHVPAHTKSTWTSTGNLREPFTNHVFFARSWFRTWKVLLSCDTGKFLTITFCITTNASVYMYIILCVLCNVMYMYARRICMQNTHIWAQMYMPASAHVSIIVYHGNSSRVFTRLASIKAVRQYPMSSQRQLPHRLSRIATVAYTALPAVNSCSEHFVHLGLEVSVCHAGPPIHSLKKAIPLLHRSQSLWGHTSDPRLHCVLMRVNSKMNRMWRKDNGLSGLSLSIWPFLGYTF